MFGLLVVALVLGGFGSAHHQCDFGVPSRLVLLSQECAAQLAPPDERIDRGLSPSPGPRVRRFGVDFGSYRTPAPDRSAEALADAYGGADQWTP